MLTQQFINTYVTIEVIIGIASVSILALYALYKFIDYLWFRHKLNKSESREQNFKPKNPLL